MIYTGECSSSTLYVGLSSIVPNLMQKSTEMDTPFLSIFSFRISRASDTTKAAMKKQISKAPSPYRKHSMESNMTCHFNSMVGQHLVAHYNSRVRSRKIERGGSRCTQSVPSRTSPLPWKLFAFFYSLRLLLVHFQVKIQLKI